MPKRLLKNNAIKWTVVLAALFVLASLFLETQTIIVILNGAFAGVSAAVLVAYRKLVWAALWDWKEYNGARQMALGIFCLWIAFEIQRAYSILFRVVENTDWLRSIPFIPLSIFFAIIGGVLQITASEYDFGPFSSRDKKTLWSAGIIGTVVAIVLIYIQAV